MHASLHTLGGSPVDGGSMRRTSSPFDSRRSLSGQSQRQADLSMLLESRYSASGAGDAPKTAGKGALSDARAPLKAHFDAKCICRICTVPTI